MFNMVKSSFSEIVQHHKRNVSTPKDLSATAITQHHTRNTPKGTTDATKIIQRHTRNASTPKAR